MSGTRALQAVTTLLLHDASLLTLPDILHITSTCKEFRGSVQQSMGRLVSDGVLMYRFLAAVPRFPAINVKDQCAKTQDTWSVAEDAWQPVKSIMGCPTAWTPKQWALYYTCCFHFAQEGLTDSWMVNGTGFGVQHVTMHMFPSGLVKHMTTKKGKKTRPYLHVANQMSSSSMRMELRGCASDGKVHWVLLGTSLYFKPAFWTNVASTNMTACQRTLSAWMLAVMQARAETACECDVCTQEHFTR